MVVIPSPIASQNTTRSTRDATDGRPGDRIAGRPVIFVTQSADLPIATLQAQASRRPVESAQYTSCDYTQVLDDHEVLASIGTVGDALDNALAESFVDSYKTELIADRVWRTRQQLELATVEWVAWFNHQRLHEALGDIPPVEYEQHHAPELAVESPVSLNGSVAVIVPRAANRLTTRQLETLSVDFASDRLIASENASVLRAPPAQAAAQAAQR